MSLKKSNSLKELLDTIQNITGESMDDIAERVGKSRPYLSKRKAQPEDDEGILKLVELLKARYGKELGERILDTDKIKTLEAWISVLANEAAFSRSLRTGEPIQSELEKLRKVVDSVIMMP